MIPIKIYTGMEANDGLKFDVNLGLSMNFQMGFSWALSNRNPASFSLSTMAMFTDPRTSQKMSFINCKKDIGGKMEFNTQFYLSDSVSLKFEGFMPNEQIETSHVGLEIMKEFNDCHVSYKIGGGS